MKTRRAGELVLDEGEYTIDVHGTSTRYTSDQSWIVVEVKGHYVAIHSTAEVPRKKPRATEQVLPVIPLVE
ncbi:hypothetical protein AAVH_18334 [Aphelenchoides avenae]|nr:hypothetical protein AAVH_18334 [Aphelenchus avenae]